jgi:transcriptional regulator with XRE-family HTH domain
MQSIAQNILGARQRTQLTQSALAQRCGIAQPNIAAFERGARTASLATLQRLAKGLGLPLEELLKEPKGENQFSRFDFETMAKDLATGRSNQILSTDSWQDLQAVFHPKLRALYPGPRRKPRIRAASALRRLKSMYGPAFLQRLNGRFSKLNLGRP